MDNDCVYNENNWGITLVEEFRLLIHFDIWLMTNVLELSYLFCRCIWYWFKNEHYTKWAALKLNKRF